MFSDKKRTMQSQHAALMAFVNAAPMRKAG